MTKHKIFLIFQNDVVVLLLLFLNQQIHVEVLDFNAFGQHLHLGVALGCLLEVFCYFP